LDGTSISEIYQRPHQVSGRFTGGNSHGNANQQARLSQVFRCWRLGSSHCVGPRNRSRATGDHVALPIDVERG
jgi:hypothetical protein